jgi:hypothetical protein
VESLGEGGVPGRVRHGTKQPTFNVLLVAETEAGADYGMRWLRRALLGSPCGPTHPSNCYGSTLCYLSSEPEMDLMEVSWGATYATISGGTAEADSDEVLSGGDAFSTGDDDIAGDAELTGGDAESTGGLLTRSRSLFDVQTYSGDSPTECLFEYLRHLRMVTFNNGPTITSKRNLRSGGTVWTATMSAVAGNPFEHGPELEVIRGFLDPDVAVPWAGGVEPAGASIDLDGFVYPDDADCVGSDPTPIYDPQHPAILLPPTAPSVPLGNFTPPSNWRRRQFTIPKQYVPLWGEMVPRVQMHARDGEVRNLRLRFYADPFLTGDISDDPCAFCGDMIVSYIPEGHTMVLDGPEEAVYVIGTGGIEQRADSLVFASDGTPFSWPSLTCGFGYVVTIDLPQTGVEPVVDLSLFERAV